MYKFYEVGIIASLLSLEKNMRVESQMLVGLPGKDKVRHDSWCIVVGINVGRVIFVENCWQTEPHNVRLEGVYPRQVEVGSKARQLVASHQFHAAGLVLTGILVFSNMGHNEVCGAIVEAVNLKVQSLQPVATSKGKLEGVYALR